MALKDILLDVGSVLGLDVTNANEQAYHIQKINEAAFELYKILDIPGCYREQIWQYSDEDNYQISFPWQVGKLRAIRHYNVSNGGKMTLENLAPRFHNERWGTQGVMKFRIAKIGAPLARSINNAALFTFTLQAVEASDVVINLVGKTANSEKFKETLTIVAGALAVTTTQSYESFETIRKTDYCVNDIVITDIDGQEMGRISAACLAPSYTIVNIREDDFTYTTSNSYPWNTVEILYKHAFVPFKNMYDNFICPDCDKIIFWKFVEHYCAYKPGLEDKARMASAKVAMLLSELCKDDDLGKDLQMQFEESPYYKMQEVEYLDRYWLNRGSLVNDYTS